MGQAILIRNAALKIHLIILALLIHVIPELTAEAQTSRPLGRNAAGMRSDGVAASGPSVDSTPAPAANKRVVFVGSSVCAGVGASPGNGWCQQFGSSLAERGWDVFYSAIGGDTSGGVLNRFDADVASLAPSVVVVCLSLNNEGLGWSDDDRAIYNNFIANIRAIRDRTFAIGATPVLAGTYPNNAYDARDAALLHESWEAYDFLGIPWINFSSLDNRAGHWPEGITWDGTHPDDEGHDAMFLSASPSLLDNMAGWDSSRIVPSSGSINLGADSFTDRPISVTPSEPMSNFTLFFRINNRDQLVGRSFCGIGGGAARIRNHNGTYSYTTSAGEDINSGVDGTADSTSWHSVCISHESINNTTRFYVDGVAVGDAVEALDPTIFSIGGRSDDFNAWANAQNARVKDILIYRTRLLDHQVQQLDAGDYTIGSLEVFVPSGAAAPGLSLPNLAPTDTRVVVNSTSLAAEDGAGAWQSGPSATTLDRGSRAGASRTAGKGASRSRRRGR